ncbi:hypothetical protein [Roseibium sp. TrichSKD4]|uniref:IS1096 element passenger TnpR family protein n=1 Tax=Roseibium sp. TrichSKD4 TaxID=744980 RepID=UPI0035287961
MVWRRVLVPSNMILREFHGVLQVAMGWDGIHLYQFIIPIYRSHVPLRFVGIDRRIR